MEKSEGTNPNKQLKYERKRRGWSQNELAERIGTDPKVVSRWERGVASPSAHFQGKLCDLFGKDAVELGFLKEEVHERSEPMAVPSPGDQGATLENVGAASSVPLQAVADSHQADVPSPQMQPLLLNMPFKRNPFFVAHADILERLHDTFGKEGSRVSMLPQALTGLGGIGKTQVAIEYIFQYQQDYQTIIWVNADSRETLNQHCAYIIDILHLTEDPARRQKSAIDTFKRWLNDQVAWLLVIDNVEDIAVINEFLPALRNGHVLLTTRTQLTGGLAHNIELGKMKEDDGALLLLRRARKITLDDPLDTAQSSDRETAKKIVQEMDGLPLAIDQAGAYIDETGCSLSHYLELYRANHARLLKRRGSPDSGYPASVATTWLISFKKVRQMNRASIELLQFLAFLAPDAIPESLIRHGTPSLTLRLRFAALDPFKLDSAIGVLRRFSFVQRNEQKVLSIHRLVQMVVRDRLSRRAQRRWARRIVKALNRAFLLDVYIPQARACATLIEQWQIVSKEAANLLYQAGDHSQQRTLYRSAKPLLLKALEMSEHVFGQQSINVMNCLISLSVVYLEQRQFDQAERCKQRVLEITRKVWGSAQSSALVPYHLDLAHRYTNQERYEEAEACYQQALASCEGASEQMSRLLFTTLYRSAELYRNERKLTEAESRYQQARTVSQNMFGAESFEAALSAKGLADVYSAQQMYPQAEELLEQLLMIIESRQEEGTFTAKCLGALADAYTLQKKQYEQAESFYQRAIAILEKVGASDSGEMLQLQSGYAVLLKELGRTGEAAPLVERAEKIYEKITTPTMLDEFLEYQRGSDQSEAPDATSL